MNNLSMLISVMEQIGANFWTDKVVFLSKYYITYFLIVNSFEEFLLLPSSVNFRIEDSIVLKF